MTVHRYVECDKNSPTAIPVTKKGVVTTPHRIQGDIDDACEEGWEERDYGDICPDCVLEELAEAQRDEESGVECGASVENSIVARVILANLAPEDQPAARIFLAKEYDDPTLSIPTVVKPEVG